ncbi:hypothetical protein H257_17440 [Aphanomyces astaci]|uniref:Uncharacterized protein n=1 Tax=Aphanomyces astaci TaxID=112090 RepID=W4FEP0_APHAT|nr:hypothetical protein H257_17440 [Aphanomyces astaci]ETV65962.1 hypothetical protein H257_17440 [Aphanomyces astaci]|eukprot:XP_009844541.1 hypothetical protein H257_17440 [Aphanomyces astaci]
MRYPPTPKYQPSPYEPAQTERGVAGPTIDEDDQEEYDATTALQFPGIRNLHYEGFTADYLAEVERHFADAKVRIHFSINPSLQRPDEQLTILNYRPEIEDICQERFGLTFRGGLLEHGQQLLGDPLQRTIQAWAAPRRGYLFLRDIYVVMVDHYAGVLDNGLYSTNSNTIHPNSPLESSCSPYEPLGQPTQSSKATPGCAELMAHVTTGLPLAVLTGPRKASIARFCLAFPSQRMAESVYAFFRRHVADPNRLDLPLPPSMKLLPLRDFCWDNPTSTFFQATSAATLVHTEVRIGRLPPLTATEDNLAALRGSCRAIPDVNSRRLCHPNVRHTTAHCLSLVHLWPPWRHLTLYPVATVDATTTSANPVTASPILTHGIASAANPSTNPPLAGTYTARTHTRAGPVDTAARDNTPAPPPNTPPRTTTRPGNSLSSSTRPRSPAPTPISVYTSDVIYPHTWTNASATFSTLDARLLEERRLREAEELLQAEDNRLCTEAQNKLNTVASGLYLPPAAPMPPVTDFPTNLLDTEEDELMALGQGPNDNMGTEPDEHMAPTTHRQRLWSGTWWLLTTALCGRVQPPRRVSPTPPLPGNAAADAPGDSSAFLSPHLTPTRPDTNLITSSDVNPSNVKSTLATQEKAPPPHRQIDSLCIASTKINKNTYGKAGDELATWFHASALDILIIADSDLPAHKATQLWTPTPSGSLTPHLMAISNHRVSILYDTTLALMMYCTPYSPSGRRISICVRLGKGSLLALIGTYCQDTPAAHREATDQEWQ